MLLIVSLIRRLVPPVREGFDAEVSSQILGVVAALFGLLLAFIVVIAYQNYGDTQSNVSNEADAIAAIVRDSGAFSKPDRDRVRAAVGVYVRAVVEDEWPRMHEGKDSASALAAVDGHLQGDPGSRPEGGRERFVLRRLRRQLSAALVARRNRWTMLRRPAVGHRRPRPRWHTRHRRLHGSRRVSERLVPRNRRGSNRARPRPLTRRAPRPDLSVLGRSFRQFRGSSGSGTLAQFFAPSR